MSDKAPTKDPYAMTVENLRRRSQAVYLACEESVAKDISAALKWSADEIERLSALATSAETVPAVVVREEIAIRAAQIDEK